MRSIAIQACTAAATLILALVAGSPPVHATPLPRFPPGAVWNLDIRALEPDPASASMIDALEGLGGFGNGRLQIDFSIRVVNAPEGAPTLTLAQRAGYYAPDCDTGAIAIPVPAGASIEGSAGMSCGGGEDCHYLVVQGGTLYEAYQANQLNQTLQSLCLVRWNLAAVYPPEGRGEHCTSADAAGFPIAPLLFNADEVYAAAQVSDGDLGHAIRFVLPNARMAADPALGGVYGGRLYVRPATHSGSPSGPKESVPYGARLRLRADFPLAGYNEPARVILRTLQRYGMLLADGGTVALTGENDRYNTHKWAELGLNEQTFYDNDDPNALPPVIGDFEVMPTGERIAETYECVRAPEPVPTLFADGFE